MKFSGWWFGHGDLLIGAPRRWGLNKESRRRQRSKVGTISTTACTPRELTWVCPAADWVLPEGLPIQCTGPTQAHIRFLIFRQERSAQRHQLWHLPVHQHRTAF